jgi:hypothetical protein
MPITTVCRRQKRVRGMKYSTLPQSPLHSQEEENNTIKRKIRAGVGMYILPALYPSKPTLAL